MDSHKTYKKLITWFWVIFASLPLIIFLVSYIGQFCIKFGDSPFFNTTNDDFVDFYWNYFIYNSSTHLTDFVYDSVPSFVIDPIMSLFIDGFGLSFGADLVGVDFAILQIAWFTWTFILIVITDLLVLFPKFAHKLLSKWGDFE